jgi:hypothetical protein
LSGPFAVFLSVLSSLLVGVVLALAPWTPLWEVNYLLQPHPSLRAVVLSPYVRGAVSGLGLVNMLLAFYELREALGGKHAGR